jgi:sRNA-binding protein
MVVHVTLLEPTDIPSVDQVAHEHAWQTRSSHRTSTGTVRYVRCARCGANRIDLEHHADEPPVPVSRVVVARTAATRS